MTAAARTLATIDVGTNTTLLLVAAVDEGEPRVLVERAEITRLGRGIGEDGRLRAANVARTLDVLRAYTAEAAAHGAPIVAIGTEALRRAPNAADFLEPARAILGAPLEVISGEREAELAFLSATRSFPEATAGAAVIIDIGGGSTEIIVARAGQVVWKRSLRLGSVRLTERHVKSDPPTPAESQALVADIQPQLAPVPFPPGATLIGTAGTVTTLAAMALQLDTYDPAVVHGHRLARPILERVLETLSTSTQAQRQQMPGLDPRRADVIFAGGALLLQIVRAAGAADLVVSDRGLRWGLLYEAMTRAA